MGNFQRLAQKVLATHPSNTKVSCFTSLEKETGNFQGKSGNSAGNFERISYEERQCITAFKEETWKETSRKPVSIDQEIFAANINNKSFLINGTTDMLEGFFLARLG